MDDEVESEGGTSHLHQPLMVSGLSSGDPGDPFARFLFVGLY